MFIKPCKGKDISKVPTSKLEEEKWYGAIKYDGNYIQIHCIDNKISFFTSGGKEFYLPNMANKLKDNIQASNWVIEAEYIHDCEGKLGDRKKSAILTTYRVMFNKDLEVNDDDKDIIYIFDIIRYADKITTSTKFSERVKMLHLFKYISSNVRTVLYTKDTLVSLRKDLPIIINLGWEGLFLKHTEHLNLPGKRVNTAIKLKQRPTADLECVDIKEGEGKYVGMIGSLVLRDSTGREVFVGSGLDDTDRNLSNVDKFVGSVIEIEYEQILDTYIQPVFKQVRDDKTIGD